MRTLFRARGGTRSTGDMTNLLVIVVSDAAGSNPPASKAPTPQLLPSPLLDVYSRHLGSCVSHIEVFAPDEIAIVHVMNRVVRRCFLLGNDEVTGKNYDHRKIWVEDQLQRLAASFGIDSKPLPSGSPPGRSGNPGLRGVCRPQSDSIGDCRDTGSERLHVGPAPDRVVRSSDCNTGKHRGPCHRTSRPDATDTLNDAWSADSRSISVATDD